MIHYINGMPIPSVDYIDANGAYTDGGVLVQFKSPLYQHQVECLRRFATAPYFALLAEMGTGKTCIAINNFLILNALGAVKKMLVVAPNGVQWNWVKNELPKHLPDAPYYHILYAGYGASLKKKDKESLEAVMSLNNQCTARILCVNWDSFSNAKGLELVNKFLDLDDGYTMMVLDESDYAKNPDSKRSKNILTLASKASYRRIMTGTPITNSPFDAWAQFQFLDPSILQCSSFIAFKQRHGVFLPPSSGLVQSIMQRTGRAPKIQATDKNGFPKFRNLDLLTSRIQPYSFMVKKSECIDLPEKIYQNLYVDLTPLQRKVYDRIKNEALIIIGNNDFDLPNQLSMLSSLCLCTGNHYPPTAAQRIGIAQTPEQMRIDPETNPKLDALLEIVKIAENNNDKVLVWARYVSEIVDIMEALQKNGIKAVGYYGAMSMEARNKSVDSFQNGDAMVFVSNQQCGGTGLTLTAGNVVVYFSNSFSLHDRLQSEDRCHRIGQKKYTMYINLLARNTIDEQIQKVLDNKQDVAQVVLNFSKAHLRDFL